MYFLERQGDFSLFRIGNYYIGFQTHRLWKVPRRNCGPCSSCRYTWRTVPPAGLPGSSGIPAQTYIGLIKLAVIKDRSRRRGGEAGPRKRRSGFWEKKEKPSAQSIASLFTARRAFSKAPRVNKGKIICGMAKKKKKKKRRTRIPSRRVCREEVRIFAQTCECRHVWCATCAAALQFPGRLLIAGERNGGYFAQGHVCESRMQLGNVVLGIELEDKYYCTRRRRFFPR